MFVRLAVSSVQHSLLESVSPKDPLEKSPNQEEFTFKIEHTYVCVCVCVCVCGLKEKIEAHST